MNKNENIFQCPKFSTVVDILLWRAVRQAKEFAFTYLLDGETNEVNITYQELDQQVRSIAAMLQSTVKKGESALLLYPPGVEFITAFLGCLYSEVVAIPAYPPRKNKNLLRLQAIALDAEVKVALTTQSVIMGLERQVEQGGPLSSLQLLSTEELPSELAKQWQKPEIESDSLAFLQYTSGSTGKPKGVMINHGNLMHNQRMIQSGFGHTNKSVGVGWLPMFHDMGLIGNMLQPLYVGFPCIHMSPVAFLQKPFRWLHAISRYKATTSGGPNFAFDLCAQKITPEEKQHLDLSCWQVAFCGAEPVRADTLERFSAAFGSCGFRKEAFYPCYGMAETTLVISGGAKKAMPVVCQFDGIALEQDEVVVASTTSATSRKIVGCGQALLDQNLILVDPETCIQSSPGRVGEIWTRGPSVAQGYWKDIEKTEEIFHAHIADTGEGPFLRTGDLGFIQEGELFVTGRLKDLIIIRGRNHYPQDIELTVEGSHPSLQIGGGAAISIDVEGQERLVIVHEVQRKFLRKLDIGKVVRAIQQAVSEAHGLQVHAIMLVKPMSIPKTSSGKIQRHACKARFLAENLAIVVEWRQNYGSDSQTFFVEQKDLWQQLGKAPESDRKKILVSHLQIEVASIMGLKSSQLPGPNQGFFELGMDSMKAVEFKYRLDTILGIALPSSIVFDCGTIQELSEYVSEKVLKKENCIVAGHESDSLSKHDDRELGKRPLVHESNICLSYAQQRLWFLDQLEPNSSRYNINTALNISGNLDVDILSLSLNEIIRRHESFRTTFVTMDGKPQQVIASELKVPLSVKDLSHLDELDREKVVLRLAKVDAQRSFNLAHLPLVRWKLLRLSDREYVLLLNMHHIISDGWSMGVLIRELNELYGAFSTKRNSPLVELPIQYADFALWQRRWLQGDELTRQLSYWEQELGGELPVLDLPTDRPRPEVQTSHHGATQTFLLPADIYKKLKELSQCQGVTLFMTLLAAFKTMLFRYTGQEDIIVGSPIANRSRVEFEGLIGFFVNTLALRTDLSGNPTFANLLTRVKENNLKAYAHQDLPFEMLVEKLQPERDLGRTQVFQVMFILQKIPQITKALPGLTMGHLEVDNGTSKFDVTLSLQEAEEGLSGSFEYNTDLFDIATIDRMIGHFRTLLEGIVVDPEKRLSDLPLLTQSELHRIFVDWNSTEEKYPKEKCIHHLFEAQVQKSPDAIAVAYEDQHLTYKELNVRANQLAHHLIGLGVKAETKVAICVERSLEMMVGVLGILKAGGAYVPWHPNSPDERLSCMVEDCTPMVLITLSWLKDFRINIPDNIPVIELDLKEQAWHDRSSHNPEKKKVGIKPDHLAYIIYTSGSTGNPKGVMIEHRGVVNYLSWAVHTFDPVKDSVVSSSLAFDLVVTSLFPPLICGGRVTLLKEGNEIDGLEKIMTQPQKPTMVKITPSHLEILGKCIQTKAAGCGVELFVIGGETLSTSVLQMWQQILPSGRFMNHYGPTEAIVGCVTNEVSEVIGGRRNIPIGKPIANKRIYILDAHRHPVPIGVTGELYIGGIGLSRGYHNRPELTAQCFVQDPFVKVTPEQPQLRMYKTGDLARFLPTGDIEFLGRNDFQVKVRGFRIEIGEIETRLIAIEGVKEAIVLAREDSPGDKRLIAYYTGNDVFTAATLRSHLLKKLPEYMVPVGFVRIESLPLTPNGKLNRKALPSPEGDAFSVQTYEAPKGEAEVILAEIWTELLHIERVGRHDHFFQLGGHSLMAVTLISHMRKEGLYADVRTLFTTPVLCDLAAATKREAQHVAIEAPPNLIPVDCQHITPELLPLLDLTQVDIERIVQTVPEGTANIQDIYPLVSLQEGILFHHRMMLEGDVYLLPTVIAFDTQGQRDNFVDALQRVIDRHDILRTSFLWEELPEPVQVVWKKATLLIEEVILNGENTFDALLSHMDPFSHRMDVRQAPLMSAYFATDKAKGRWLLGLLGHHLAIDHTSLQLIVEEVQAHLVGEEDRLPAPFVFRNFVAQARYGVSREEHKTFFRKMLGMVDESTAPFGLTDVRQEGSDISEAILPLDSILCRQLRESACKMGVSVASLCHLAWAQVLSRLTGREEVVFGTVLFGRMSGQGAERAIGMFINTLPVRISTGDEPVEQAVRITHTQLAQLLYHEQAPLSLAQSCSAVPAPTPLFTSLLNYRYSLDKDGSEFSQVAWEGMKKHYNEERTNYPFTMNVDDFGESLVLKALVQDPIDPMRICRYMNNALTHLTEALEQTPQTAVRFIEIMSAVEQHKVLYEWNATEVQYPTDRCIHQLFEAQAEKTPDDIAVVCEENSITYKELNKQANHFAHRLIGLGVKPDTLVAIGAERSIEMVVGLLAILKAGGAYVPLDPVYPAERLEFILKDSAPFALLTQKSLKERWKQFAGQIAVIELDAETKAWQKQSATNPNPVRLGLRPSHLAYVIYTSGSTGKPKGVAIEHRNVVNFITWSQRVFTVENLKQSLFATSINFDLAVYECFAPLTTGGTVNLVANTLALIEESQDVTLINTVPSVMTELVRADAVPKSTQVVNLAGEALKRGLVESIFAGTDVQTVCNLYGPSETTTYSSWTTMNREQGFAAHIGRPIANTNIYILDGNHQPVPIGVTGELYIGGAGVARGYLNRPELTAECFLPDPFVKATMQNPHPRMYKTGDLGRFSWDGNIEFLGRNDFQVKIRGFRIELGEIEAELIAIKGVREAVVTAREDTFGNKRLIAYCTSNEEINVEILRSHLSSVLPYYMVPTAYVQLEVLPLTPNGKIDRKALLVPEGDAFSVHTYEAPKGKVELILAEIWAELLDVKMVGRHDHFFELGGHSLMAVTFISRMHTVGMHVDVRTLFTTPVLYELAAAISATPQPESTKVPPNLIGSECTHITPELLPLLDLTQSDIDRIVKTVPQGVANIQDIYPLVPLQEGILFHHLMAQEGDVYLMSTMMAFDTQKRLDAFVNALQNVIDRHDSLRTAVQWEGLFEPVQVVWRKAPLSVEEVILSGDNAVDALLSRIDPHRHRIDVRKAPMMHAYIAEDKAQGRWLLGLWIHHLVNDHTTLELIVKEVQAHLLGEQQLLPEPVPYRNFVVQARYDVSREEHEAFFGQMLGMVDEPTAPFGLLDVQQDGSDIAEATLPLDSTLCRRLRERARNMGVSIASLCHLAWAQVLSRLTGREDVVFGTVLFGRMQGGQDSEMAMGMFINTLPVRIVTGDVPVEEAVHATHSLLAELLHHEHAPLSLAQSCSAVPAPLFSAILNYRHSQDGNGSDFNQAAWDGMEVLSSEERSNYPFALSVDDYGDSFGLTAQVLNTIDPMRVCGYMHSALAHLTDALEQTPKTPVRSIEVMGAAERQKILFDWNATEAAYPKDKYIHELFEAQVKKFPDAIAVVYEDKRLTYKALNMRANRLAHHLIGQGIGPGDYIAIGLRRSAELIIAELAVLKCGAIYVPLDPEHPSERLAFILLDTQVRAVITNPETEGSLPLPETVGQPVIVYMSDPQMATGSMSNPPLRLDNPAPAYVMYTSGSTGEPKGVVVPQCAVLRLVINNRYADFTATDRVAFAANPAFDAATMEVWAPLLNGGCIVVIEQQVLLDPMCFAQMLKDQQVTILWLTVGLFNQYTEILSSIIPQLNYLIVGGDALDPKVIRNVLDTCPPKHLLNGYGPTETTTFAITHEICEVKENASQIPLGRPIANTRIYILDGNQQPVPTGVTGELYIGGAGVACGYLNRPELTAERFLSDPFVDPTEPEPNPRIYKTGDLCRFLPDGNIEFLGRNDFQVKIRGYRIELGEIEARLTAIEGIKEATVLATDETSGEKRLIAYYSCSEEINVETLRSHLSDVLPDHMVPAAYVRLAVLPLTPNGKVERKALPVPEGDAFSVRAYEAPMSELEHRLAIIWSELLHVKWIGSHDNFFDLGGHSLLAIQMVGMLKQEGIEVQVAALFSHPTLERLASFIEGEKNIALPSGANPIRRRGGDTPLFLVHEASGEVLYGPLLSRHIDSDIPVYGLAGPRLGEKPIRTMFGQAARLVRIIRAVQPFGPYRIAGWSFGGSLAYEIATQLLGEDEIVEFLGLIDSINYAGIDLKERVPLDDNTILLNSILGWKDGIEYSLRAQMERLSKTADLETFVKTCQKNELVPQNMSFEDIRNFLVRWKANVYVLDNYQPQPISIPMCLFRAMDEKDTVFDRDAHLNWAKFLPETQIRVIPVPGTHQSMMIAPHIEILGRSLSGVLRQATAAEKPLREQSSASLIAI